MKVTRQRKVKKYLSFYKSNFGIEAPLNVLVDGTFCKAALLAKVNIIEQVTKYLGSEARFFTTPCVLAECEALGRLLYGPLKVLQQYTSLRCNHKPFKAPNRCIVNFVKDNKKSRKFIVATQDTSLREKLNSRSGIPILYIHYNAITLEKPSQISRCTATSQNQTKLEPSIFETNQIVELKRACNIVDEKPLKKRRKRTKGPNPLSCLKPKKKSLVVDSTSAVTDQQKRKRTRRRKRGRTNAAVNSAAQILTLTEPTSF